MSYIRKLSGCVGRRVICLITNNNTNIDGRLMEYESACVYEYHEKYIFMCVNVYVCLCGKSVHVHLFEFLRDNLFVCKCVGQSICKVEGWIMGTCPAL